MDGTLPQYSAYPTLAQMLCITLIQGLLAVNNAGLMICLACYNRTPNAEQNFAT
ncbi:hypothetical protein KM043_000146, partial [Ampulex compressa]